MLNTVRRTAASLLIAGAPVPAVLDWWNAPSTSNPPLAVWISTALLPVIAGLVHVRRLELQVLARAVLWSNLVWFALMCVVAGRPGAASNIIMWWSAGIGTALLVLGRVGLDAPSHREAFAPVALRGTLVAILVLALADTLALTFWSTLAIEERAADIPVVFVGTAGALMLVAVYGLYRLRTWGFVLNVGANIAIAAGAWLVPDMPEPLLYGLTATAVGQLIAGLPLLRGMMSHGAEPTTDVGRTSQAGAVLVLATMLVIFVRLW